MSIILEELKKAAAEKKNNRSSSQDYKEKKNIGIREDSGEISDGLTVIPLNFQENILVKEDSESKKTAKNDGLDFKILEPVLPEPSGIHFEETSSEDNILNQNLEDRLASMEGDSAKEDIKGSLETVLDDSALSEVEEKIEVTKVDKPKHIDSDQDKQKKDDSFDWSLGKIPAFNKEKGDKDKDANFLKMVSAVKKKPTSSFKTKGFLVFLLLILLIILIAFYLMSHYQSKQVAAEHDLIAYRLDKLDVQSYITTPPSQENIEQELKKDNLQQDELLIPNFIIISEAEELLTGTEVAYEFEIKPPKPSLDQQPENNIETTQEPTTFLDKQADEINAGGNVRIKSIPSKEMLAYKAYLDKDFITAEKFYLESLSMNPNSLPALFGLGSIAIHRGEYHKAKSFYKRAASISPNHPAVKKAMAQMSLLSGSNLNRRGTLRSLIEKHPKDANLPYALGNLYARKGNWVRAQQYYFKAYELDSLNFDFALNLAVSLDHLGEYVLAKQYYKIALSLSKNDKMVNVVVLDSVKSRLQALKMIFSGDKSE